MIAACLAIRFVLRGKTRFFCAAAGVAAAAGISFFSFSLAETSARQAPALAKKACAPWSAWKIERGAGRGGGRDAPKAAAPSRRAGGPEAANGNHADLVLPFISCKVDHRPGGRVIQGPPMLAILAPSPGAPPWGAAPLAEGKWPDPASPSNEICIAKSAFGRFAREGLPPIGSELKFEGENGTMTARISGYLADAKLPRGFPNVFANPAAFKAFAGERRGRISLWREMPETPPDGILTPESDAVVEGFGNDDTRRMDYARPLMIAAAILTALSLIANSLLLSVEANRRELAMLRLSGMKRSGTLKIVAFESLLESVAGCAAGCFAAAVALFAWTAAHPETFPLGAFFPAGAAWATAAAVPCVSIAAALCACRAAMSVRPLEASEAVPPRRRRGMAAAFACGYAAFAAVEVWGATLMRAFVPSPELPDAIVSLLPAGASEYDIEKIRKVGGIRRASQLYPLQLPFSPPEEMPARGPARGPARKQYRNALVLGAEFLPRFKMKEGTWEECSRAIAGGDACVICEMVSRARNLHKGDRLVLRAERPDGSGEDISLEIAGVADVNWHMVTSRGIVRGLNGAPPMTDGPAFVSLATAEYLAECLGRSPFMSRMTHVWIDYEKDFLEREGVFPAGRKIEEAVRAALGDPKGAAVRLHARDEIADGTLAHGSDLIGQMARIPVFFLAVLSIGFVAMLVANADASRRELDTLRAVGATRTQLAWRLVRGALATAARGILCGLPAGAAAGWLFAGKTGSMWPGLPVRFEVPWRVIAEGTAVALAFVLAVSVPAALRLVKSRNRSG